VDEESSVNKTRRIVAPARIEHIKEAGKRIELGGQGETPYGQNRDSVQRL